MYIHTHIYIYINAGVIPRLAPGAVEVRTVSKRNRKLHPNMAGPIRPCTTSHAPPAQPRRVSTASCVACTRPLAARGTGMSVAVCCALLRCGAACYSLLQSVAVCCIVLQYFAVVLAHALPQRGALVYVLQSVAVCCSLLQSVAVCCSCACTRPLAARVAGKISQNFSKVGSLLNLPYKILNFYSIHHVLNTPYPIDTPYTPYTMQNGYPIYSIHNTRYQIHHILSTLYTIDTPCTQHTTLATQSIHRMHNPQYTIDTPHTHHTILATQYALLCSHIQ